MQRINNKDFVYFYVPGVNQGAVVEREVEGGAENDDNHPPQPNTPRKCGEEEEA